LPGFVSDGGSSTVVQCGTPAAERCVGWDGALGQVRCGAGYLQGSPGCGTCSAGWYADRATGRCLRCPDVSDLWTVVRVPLQFLGGLAAVGAVMFSVMLLVRHFRGGTVSGGAKRVVKFTVQVFAGVQIVVSMQAAAQPGLPPLLQTLYGSLGALQVSTPATHVHRRR
jgi:hypothetical protein